jgi:hypothetical protein
MKMKVTLMGSTLIWVSFTALSLIFAGIGDAEIDPSTILGLWLLDEGKGDRVEDSSGNGNHGINFGKWTDGKFGKAVDLSGVYGDHVRIEDSPNLGEMKEITVAAWVFLHSFVGGYDGFVDKTRGGQVGWRSYNLSRRGEKWEWKIVPDDNISQKIQEGTSVIEKWIHLAGTYDGNEIKLYENAVEIGAASEKDDGSKIFEGRPVHDSDTYMAFGHWPGGEALGQDTAMEGIIDEVVIFNVALTADDLQSIMTQGLAAATAVELRGKLAITWGAIKAG